MAFRVVQQSLWTDEKVLDNYSCEDKYFWLYLLTNPQTNQLGIYKLPVRLAAFQLGYSKEQVLVLIDRFENVLKQIKYNRQTQEIAIGNYLAYSVIKGGKPVYDCVLKDLSKINDLTLIDFVLRKLKNKDITNQTVLEVIEILKEKSTKKEIYLKENDNDNDNDDSWYDSCTDSQKSEKIDYNADNRITATEFYKRIVANKPAYMHGIDIAYAFDVLYEEYPLHKSKKDSANAFLKNVQCKETKDRIKLIAIAIDTYKRLILDEGRNPQYVKHMSTFINNSLDDEIPQYNCQVQKEGHYYETKEEYEQAIISGEIEMYCLPRSCITF